MSDKNPSKPTSSKVNERLPSPKVFNIQIAPNKEANEQKSMDEGHSQIQNSSHEDEGDSNILGLDSPKIKREFDTPDAKHQHNETSPQIGNGSSKKSKTNKGSQNSNGNGNCLTTKDNAQGSTPTDLYKSIASKISAQIQNINKFHKGKDQTINSDQQSLQSESEATLKFQISRHSKKEPQNDEDDKKISNHDDYLNKLENELIQNEESLLQTQEQIEEKQLPTEQLANSKMGQVDQLKEKKLDKYYKENNFSQPNYSETLFNSQSSLLKRGENVDNNSKNSKTILSQSSNQKETKISIKSNKAKINLKKVIKTSLSQQSDKNSFGERRSNSAKKIKKQKKNAEKNQSLSQTSLPTQPLNTNLMNDKDSYRQERAIKPYSQKSKQILCKEQNSQEIDYKLDRRSSGQYSQTENAYRNDRIGLFSEEIAVFGHVPLIFFMPNISKHNIDFINSNGGEVTHLVECFTIQLFKPTGDKHQDRGDSAIHKANNIDTSQIPIEEYYPGNVVSWYWLIDMINKCERLPVDPYIIMKIEYPQNSSNDRADKYAKMQFNQMKKLSGQRTRFTIRELIKIFQVTQEFPSKKNKNQVYWQRFIKQGVFPGRSVNSVNAQWQRFCHYDTIEQAIHKAYQLGMPYSTSFPQLPPIIKEEFEQRLLSIKGEMGLGNFIPQSNLNTSQIKPNKPKMIKTQQYQYSQRDYVQFKTDYGSIKTKSEDIFNNRMSNNLHRSMNIGQKRVHHHIIGNSNAQENQNAVLPRQASQSMNQRMIKQESCVVNQNQAYSNPLLGEKYQKNDQKSNYQNEQSQYKCSKDPCSFLPNYGAKSNQKQFNQSQSKDACAENNEMEPNDIERDQSSSNSDIVRASSSGDLIKVKCEDNEFDFNNNQQFISHSSFDKLSKAKSKKQFKKIERQKSLNKHSKVQNSFKHQYQANNDCGEQNVSGNNNQYEQQSYGQIDEAHLNINKNQIENANFEKAVQATTEHQAYNPTKDVENSQNVHFSSKFQNPQQAQYKCGYIGKPNTAQTDISADYQQAQSSSAIHQQNVHLQMPHGNSLAMAKECIYCIAKRICLQSTMEFTSTQPLCNRFAKLNDDQNFEQDQNKESIKQMLKKSDNTWAQLIAVTINQSNQSDSYQMQGKKRQVQINQDIDKIDDLEYSQRRSADNSNTDQKSNNEEGGLNQIERIELNSNNPLVNSNSQQQMQSDHHNSQTNFPTDSNMKNNVKKFQINRKLLMSQPNQKIYDNDNQSQNKERGPSQYLNDANNDLKSDMQIEDTNSILGTEKSNGPNEKALQANQLVSQSKQQNETCIQESDIQDQSQVQSNSVHINQNDGEDQIQNDDSCVKQMGEQIANSPMYNNAFIEQSQQNSGILEGEKSQYQSNDGFAYESPNQHYDNQQHQMFQQSKHQQQIRQYPNDMPEFIPSNNGTSISNGGYHQNPINGQFQNQINQGQTYFINNSQNFWNMREFSPGQAYPNQQYPYQSEIQNPQTMVGHYPQQPQHYPPNVNILQNYSAASGYYLIPQPNLNGAPNFNDRTQQPIQQSYDMDGTYSYSERNSNYNTQNPANNRALMHQLPNQPPIQSQQCLPTYYSNASNEYKN